MNYLFVMTLTPAAIIIADYRLRCCQASDQQESHLAAKKQSESDSRRGKASDEPGAEGPTKTFDHRMLERYIKLIMDKRVAGS